MPTVRLTAFFRDDDGHGWSETHDKDGGSTITSLTTFLVNFNTLMQTFRRPMLSGDAYYIGCRGSYRTANGTIAGDNLLLDPPLRGPQTFSGIALEMGAPNTAVKIRFRNDSSTARSDAYTRGGWAQLATAGVLNLGGVLGAEWKLRADTYAANLITGGYGWIGVDPTTTSRGDVSGYVVNVDGTVTFTVAPTNAIPLPAAGTKLSVSFARINDSRSTLNRELVCVVQPGLLSLKTIQRVAAGEFESAGTYIAQRKGFIPYAALSYYKLGSRKCGRPFGLAPGRLPVRALS
jgi:hypothetical protein